MPNFRGDHASYCWVAVRRSRDSPIRILDAAPKLSLANGLRAALLQAAAPQ
jgi:hypothetical protein